MLKSPPRASDCIGRVPAEIRLESGEGPGSGPGWSRLPRAMTRPGGRDRLDAVGEGGSEHIGLAARERIDAVPLLSKVVIKAEGHFRDHGGLGTIIVAQQAAVVRV
jgi:hypothetical protein